MHDRTPLTFDSVELEADLRTALLQRLQAAHRQQPLAPDDPRGTVARVRAHLAGLGLHAERFRGTVSVDGVEVDHVWLAVDDRADAPWVLDAAFPLLDSRFVGLLAGWVAGTTTSAELAAVAATADVDRRVVGAIPPRATYRGQPVWSSRS